MATVAQLKRDLEFAEFDLQQRRTQLAQAERDLANSRADPNLQDLIVSQLNAVERARGRLEQAEGQVNSLQTQIAAQQSQGPDTQSSGQIQQNADTASDNGAKNQTPSIPSETIDAEGDVKTPAPTTVATNAEKFQPAGDVGTTQPVRRIDQTQATPPVSNQDDAPPSPSQNSGAGAPSDDNQPPRDSQASNLTQVAIDKKYGQPIIPQANILDQYASMSYTISIYLSTGPDYQRILQGKQKYLPGFQLLIQSGGAPIESGDIPATTIVTDTGESAANGPSLTQGRNKFFDLDFYIDNLQLTHFCPGKGSNGAHNVTDINFRLMEPNGMTLFQRLYRAVQEYVAVGGGGGFNGPKNYADATYLMVLRWYGYDQNGKMIQPKKKQDNQSATTDPLAVAEKFIPFKFKAIKFRVANKIVEYDCEAVALHQEVAQTQGRGVIPYNIEITATTLKNLLNGNLQRTTAITEQAPEKANTAPQKDVIQAGLASALNQYQRELVATGKIGVADEYAFVIVEPELANAQLRPPGLAKKGSWGMIKPATPAQAKDGKKQTPNANSKNVSATAGMSIVQFLDLAVRNTTYIYDQQTKVVQGNEQILQGSAQYPAWYTITTQAEPIDYDPIRNLFACKISYQISMYRVPMIMSDYFPEGRFYGTHKVYNYWFTGQNTSILRFEQDFNYQFYLTINSEYANVANYGTTNDYREIIKKFYSPNSAQSAQGNQGNTNEPGANGADFLYDPGSQGEVRMEIVGDPAWIMQGNLLYGVLGPDVTDANQVNFLSDGTINYTSQDVLFEIGFNAPADYDLNTGLMPIDRYRQ